jgi:aspartokinase-like uncharacterized kinase
MINKRKFIGVVVGSHVYADMITMADQAFNLSEKINDV